MGDCSFNLWKFVCALHFVKEITLMIDGCSMFVAALLFNDIYYILLEMQKEKD